MEEGEEKIKARVRQQFGASAGDYVTSPTHASRDDLGRLVKWLDPRESWVALDVATGGGHTAKALAPHIASVVALDMTADMLEVARAHLTAEGHPNVFYVLGDAEAMPFLKGSFDALTCRIAAHHFVYPERFLSEAARVLRPGGKLLFIDNVAPEEPRLADFMNTFERLRDVSHVRCRSRSEWLAMMQEAGFALTRERQGREDYDFPTWVRRMARTPEQISQVECYILSAPQEVQAYFSVETQGRALARLQVDGWMALLTRTGD